MKFQIGLPNQTKVSFVWLGQAWPTFRRSFQALSTDTDTSTHATVCVKAITPDWLFHFNKTFFRCLSNAYLWQLEILPKLKA